MATTPTAQGSRSPSKRDRIRRAPGGVGRPDGAVLEPGGQETPRTASVSPSGPSRGRSTASPPGSRRSVTAIGEIDRLRTDNEALLAENERLEAENDRLAEFRRENDLLTALLQLRAGFDFETAAAAVIARESSEFRRTVTLDKGTESGIAVGDVVVASGGALAGRVTEVGPDERDRRPADRRRIRRSSASCRVPRRARSKATWRTRCR